jgi:hypothetical protein
MLLVFLAEDTIPVGGKLIFVFGLALDINEVTPKYLMATFGYVLHINTSLVALVVYVFSSWSPWQLF